jgi:hypothetical protein
VRARGFGVLVGALLATAAVYACSSSTTSPAASTGNDSGAEAASASDSGGADVGSDSTTLPVNDSGASLDSESGSIAQSGSDSAGSDSASSSSNCNQDGGSLPLCSSLPGTLVYIQSADTQETVLDIVGRELRDSANITLAFELTGSCTVVPDLYQATPFPTNTNLLYIPSTAECPTWTSSDPELTCVTSASDTTPIDLGIAALFPASCDDGPPPAGIGTFIGPIQAYTFVVPTAEFQTQTAISAEEAYYAFGDGLNNPVTWNGNAEWNVPSQFYLRPSSKSTLVSTALNIGLTPTQMTLATADGGTSDGRQLLASSTDVVTAVAAATSPQAIGILGSEVYDGDRGKGINVLAFSGFGQTNQYFPDSTTTSFDKQNIRNGNYTLWSPAVLIAPVSADAGVPSNPTVKYLTDVILGNPGATPPGGFVDGGEPIDGLGATVSAGLTPDCAMQVQRSADGAPVTSYTPPAPCTCYFLSKVPSAAALPASCVACSASTPCATGSCFNGYCEVTPPPAVTATQITKTGLVFPTTADGGLAPLNP